jgi:hypothetical protein
VRKAGDAASFWLDDGVGWNRKAAEKLCIRQESLHKMTVPVYMALLVGGVTLARAVRHPP